MVPGRCRHSASLHFTVLIFSEADPKGSDCYEKFSVMQECMSQYPELYGKDDDDDDELAAAMEQAAGETAERADGGDAGDKANEEQGDNSGTEKK